LLVGTTLEVLAQHGRRILRDARWRRHLRDHAVVIGYGTKGRSAARVLVKHDFNPGRIVVIDNRASAITDANLEGYAAIEGDATSRDTLRRAEISSARHVILTLNRDDSAILTMLTVRQLNPGANVVASVREEANAPLMRQSGASAVITSSEAVGRLLGLSAISPNLGTVMEDLLSSREGLDVAERHVRAEEVGRHLDELRGDPVVAVVRNSTLRRFYDPAVSTLEPQDKVVVIRNADMDRSPPPG
jgi:voltage-gated potassium channel